MPKCTSAGELRAIIQYDSITGVFTWRKDGTVASRTRTDGRYAGYVRVYINGYPNQAARLAWLYVHGEMPDGEVDHINQVRSDNRIANLRVTTREQNARNLKMNRRNTSGVTGVHLIADSKLWCAQIWIKGRRNIYLGHFRSIGEAIEARVTAEKRFFGEFAPQR